MADSDEGDAQLESDLPGAIARGEIIAVYQPQFALDNGGFVAAEILARWEHPIFGTVPPSQFVPLAEQSGVIDGIGEHMFRLACETAADWEARRLTTEIAINVSLLQFRSRSFVDRLLGILMESRVDPQRLIIEITESTAAANVEDARAALERLASVGLTISIDDFGSGNSNEHQVTALPARELKIDQSIVQDESANGRGALAFLVSFGKARGMRIVAEGVSTDSQLERVRELGCDRAQGFLLGKPATLEALNTQLPGAVTIA